MTLLDMLAGEFPDYDFKRLDVTDGNLTLTMHVGPRTMAMRFRDPRPHFMTDPDAAFAEIVANVRRAVDWPGATDAPA